ncbi:D-alanyl-D-alanine carboxypeptidase family protein [Neisseria sp. Ec49-e6-T10]|uniref:D-alanyl-D-alanine carboxypeptidase family protein n=1 Tax=Neisseria sp. Ec49-e6-T10 TaxID=3140744 RepID=UPI003EBFB146
MKNFKYSLLLLLSLSISNICLADTDPFEADPLGAFLEDHFNQPQMTTPDLSSGSAIVINSKTGDVLFAKNTETVRPIASITKLITAMVVLDAQLPMEEMITITSDEIDRRKGTGSRLGIGTTLSRRQLLQLALMSSENRAAHALARSYPGGTEAFIARMNRKVQGLGMRNTVFFDPTGLDNRNVSTASDLALAVKAAYDYPIIRRFSTSTQDFVENVNGKTLSYKNSNVLVREGLWEINVQKTGYIREAGRCVVMHAKVGQQPLIIVLLNSRDSSARTNDARTIKTWLEKQPQLWL